MSEVGYNEVGHKRGGVQASRCVATETSKRENEIHVNLASPVGHYKSNPFEVGPHLAGRYTGQL